MTQQPGSSEHGDQPGKTRTWWHPLLARMLAFALDSAFKVEQEVSVGKLPLRVRHPAGSPRRRTAFGGSSAEISELLPLLNRFTLIEFKGPTDAVERGDFAQLVGCSFLWLQPAKRAGLPRGYFAYCLGAGGQRRPSARNLRLLGCEVSQHESGILRVEGLPFTTWLVETDVMAERGQPILSLVSRVFLNDRRSIIEKLARGGHEALANYHYMVQQVKQFRIEEDFAMQQALTENLEQFDKDLCDQAVGGASCRAAATGLIVAGTVAGDVAAGTVAGNVAAGVCGRPEPGREGTISRVVPGERRPLKMPLPAPGRKLRKRLMIGRTKSSLSPAGTGEGISSRMIQYISPFS